MVSDITQKNRPLVFRAPHYLTPFDPIIVLLLIRYIDYTIIILYFCLKTD